MYYVLFNPLAGNGTGEQKAKRISEFVPGIAPEFLDITKTDYKDLFTKATAEDIIVICGGDGTINRFANDTDGLTTEADIQFFAGGTGNDLMNDLEKPVEGAPVSVKKVLEDLPTVEVNGKKSKFINGIGFGIDGYCCEEGDKQRAVSDKPVNYAGIAIKGVLGKFKPLNATVTVDGKTTEYKKVWLAPAMNGRFIGGGMMQAPDQDRFNKERTLTSVVWYGSGRLKTLMVFPSIFKGKHVEHTEIITVLKGKEITVKFDRPCALQIDGETVLNVTEYTARSSAL